MNIKINLSILILLGTVFLVACGDGEKSTAKSKEKTEEVASNEMDADTLAGKEAFEMSCASCHGELGKGDGAAGAALNPKPRNFKAPASEWKNGPTIAGITKTLNNGIEGTSMVAYKHLGDETLGQIAKYVLYLHEN